MEVSGKIKKLLEKQTFGSGFSKRELILLTQEQYPQTLSIEFHQDRIDLLNEFKEGDDVKISINLRGREWVNPEGVTKYFNSIVGWRIEKTTESTSTPQMPTTPPTDFNNDFNDLSSDNGETNADDDLPF